MTRTCRWCGLEITNGHGFWTANEELLEDAYRAGPTSRTEPWFDACPGTPELLAAYPTFGEYYVAVGTDLAVPRQREFHEPLPTLIQVAQEAVNHHVQ